MTERHERKRTLWLAPAAIAVALVWGFFQDPTGAVGRIDLAPTYIAARLYATGNTGAIYANTPYGFDRSEHWIALENETPRSAFGTVFAYCPAYLWLFVPIAQGLSLDALTLAVVVANWMLIGLFFLYLARIGRTPFEQAAIVLGGMLSTCAANGVQLGQNVAPLLVAAFVYARSCQSGNRIVAVISFLAANMLKPWAGVLILLPLMRREWKLAGLLLGSLALFCGLQFVIDPGAFIEYVRITLEHSRISILANNNFSLAAGLQRLYTQNWYLYADWTGAPPEPLPMKVLRFGAAAAVVFVCFRAKVNWNVCLQACLFSAFLIMNVFWDHYSLLFLPFFFERLLQIRQERKPLAVTALAGVLVFFVPYGIAYSLLSTLAASYNVTLLAYAAALLSMLPAVCFGSGLLSAFKNQDGLRILAARSDTASAAQGPDPAVLSA
ncbi:MAG: DUF2029 domain-containing protein [Spirochaetales bacterium]|nr:DUF2029 domain-containing protein [Spirochaetales bacterium]